MRITGGEMRSRHLKAPAGESTRPTSDRVREALFGILAARGAVEGARVLDLYAGSGALALEALSRGAARAVLVERGRPALEAIRANVEALGLGARAKVVAGPVERAAPRLSAEGPFDLVLVDPPYADVPRGAVGRALEPLLAGGALSAGALLVLEHAHADAPPPLAGLSAEETRRYGDTALTFYTCA